MIDWARLHVSGTHTPVPSGAAASLNVFFDGQLVASQAANRSGSFDLSPVIPTDHLSRDNTVEIRFQYVPADGVCSRAAVPVDVQLSGDSSVETRAGPSLPIGFQRLPQALLPGIDCALDGVTADRLAAAVGLFTGLQRLTRTPLIPSIVPLEQVRTSTRPAVILTTDPSAVVPLHPAVDLNAPDPLLSVDVNGVQVGVGTAQGVVQAFVQGGRQLVVAEARPEAASSLGRLVAAVTAAPGMGRWVHDVLVVAPDGHVDDVAVHDTLKPPTQHTPDRPIRVRWWEWLSLVCIPLLLATAIWRIVVWRRAS